MQFTVAYTFAKTIDWWSTSIPIPEYLVPEQWRDGRTAPVQRVADLRASLRSGQRWLNDGDVLSKIAGGWQVNTFFSFASGTLVTVTPTRTR